jgi:hypothetical protein
LDLQPDGSSSPPVEVGQEAQSMERNDLQLITIENPYEVPEWVARFDSTQLKSYFQQRSHHHRAVTGGLLLPALLLPLHNCSFQLLIRQKQSLSKKSS